ncbi:hypothetical protein TASCI_170015 [Tenacibaculum ascidiaceicola]
MAVVMVRWARINIQFFLNLFLTASALGLFKMIEATKKKTIKRIGNKYFS